MVNAKKIVVICCLAVVFTFTAALGLCVRALYAPQAVFAVDGVWKIVIDAGHGGIDGGVTGITTGVKESDLNLQISFELKERLERAGFSVVMTRKTEAGLYDTTAKGFKKRDMLKRKECIEKENPSLVISVHQNYYASASQRGAQVFYGNNSPKSKLLATALQEKLNAVYEKHAAKPRKAAFGDYFMLKCAAAPSVIVECGFLSSPLDEALLKTESWQKTLAEAITEGVTTFFIEQTA